MNINITKVNWKYFLAMILYFKLRQAKRFDKRLVGVVEKAQKQLYSWKGGGCVGGEIPWKY